MDKKAQDIIDAYRKILCTDSFAQLTLEQVERLKFSPFEFKDYATAELSHLASALGVMGEQWKHLSINDQRAVQTSIIVDLLSKAEEIREALRAKETAQEEAKKIISRTAILVIHGIGEQNPYETLDQFGRGMYNLITDNGKRKDEYELSHEVHKLENNKGDKWVDSFFRISPKSASDPMLKKDLDVHEYYWANLTENQITTGEILDWLRDTISGANKAYKDGLDIQNNPQKMSAQIQHVGGSVDENFRLTDENQKSNYGTLMGMLRKITFGFRFAQIIYAVWKFFGGIGQFFASWWGVSAKAIVKAITERFGNWASVIMVDYVGDVAIYTTMDVKKKNYDLREKILEGARIQLTKLLEDEQYDKVILAGHSLGTVIAYDALNKINIRASMEGEEHLKDVSQKIGGFVTFGSPLDKIFFFFRQYTSQEEYIRRQIITHLHSFRVRRLYIPKEEIVLKSPIDSTLFQHLKWLNFYHHQDPVSNRLDFYDLRPGRNIQSKFRSGWGVAHTGYWKDPEMYETIFAEMLA